MLAMLCGFRGCKQRLDRRHDVIDGESELLLQGLQRCRSAESMHADDPTSRADVALPAERRSLLDRNAGRDVRWQDGVAVFLRLAFEDIP